MSTHWEERIIIDPRVLTGKPVVKGTCLAVEFIIELLANGCPSQFRIRMRALPERS